MRCALLTTFRHDWAAAIVAATPGLSFHSVAGEALPVPMPDNPFHFPVSDSFDVVLVSTPWYKWLHQHHGDALPSVFAGLRSMSRAVVGLDSGDEFALSLPPEAFDHLDLVLKAQGLYRDRDLYNYEVGALFPGGNWTHKRRRRAEQYSDAALSKLRLSVPCVMLDLPGIKRAARLREATSARTTSKGLPGMSRALRNAAEQALTWASPHIPLGRRPYDVHCLMQLSHIQRLEALEQLREFSGRQGIAYIPRTVQGTEFGWNVPETVSAEIADRAAVYVQPAVPRLRFLYEITRHKIGVAPTGWGELGQRHAAVMLGGAALVCQDLSHVEMLFKIEDDRNAVFCNPDLGDLRKVVRDLLDDDDRRRRIAGQGRSDLVSWSRRWKQALDAGVAAPLREMLGDRRAPG